MRTGLVLTFAAALACTKAPRDAGSLFDETADQPTCGVVASAPDLILAAERHVLSDLAGVGDYVERGEITVSGACDSKKRCQRISAEAMTSLVARLHAMGTIHHQAKHPVSPHYGFRRITARWSGGECTFSDGVLGVIEERDHDKFYAMFDALTDVYVKAEAARDAGGSLPDR